MKNLLLVLFLPFAAYGGQADIAKIPWPKAVRDFPIGEQVSFRSGAYVISLRVPTDPEVQSLGGSGGPMVEISLRSDEGNWSATLLEQSVGERLLVAFEGRPQLEIWGRGGGGSWSRGLYRYISGEYRCVRTDEFSERPPPKAQKAATATLPGARRGRGDQQREILYFVATRQ